MEYREQPAPAHLAPWVECVWTLRGRPEGVQRVLPDGCVEIVLHYGDPMTQNGERQPRHLVAGQMDTCLLLDPAGETDVAGIRFQPEGARAFLGPPMHLLTNRFVELEALCGAPLGRRLDDDRSIDGIYRAIEDRLRNAPPPDRVTAAAVRLIAASEGEVAVDDLAARLGTIPRQLNRLFRDHVGMPPKLFAQILRFQQVLTAWDHGDWPRLADLAVECGFYDQAHMCHEFLRFCGRNPSSFFERPEMMARLFLRARRMSDSYKPRA